MYIYIFIFIYIYAYIILYLLLFIAVSKSHALRRRQPGRRPATLLPAWSAATCAVRSCRSSTVRPGFKRRKWVDWWFCELKYAKVVEMRWILWFIGTPNSFSRQPHLVFISGWQRGNHGDNICTTWTTHADWDTPHQHLLHHLGQHH